LQIHFKKKKKKQINTRRFSCGLVEKRTFYSKPTEKDEKLRTLELRRAEKMQQSQKIT